VRAFPPRSIILAVLSAFERRAPARLLRRPRMGGLATSAITRASAEKATRRNGSVRLSEGAAQAMMSSAAVMAILYIVVRAAEGALRLPLVALFGLGPMSELSPLSGAKRKLDFGAVRAGFDPNRTSASRRKMLQAKHVPAPNPSTHLRR
jgi:hypothetical protein